jgi:pre-mRNA-splicing factor 18
MQGSQTSTSDFKHVKLFPLSLAPITAHKGIKFSSLTTHNITMDFASIMKSQIAASKSSSETKQSDQKYLRRSEREALEEAAYHAEQEKLESQRQEKLEKKRKFEDEEATKKRERDEKRRRLAEVSRKIREEEEAREESAKRKRLGLPELPQAQPSDAEDGVLDGEQEVVEDELVKQLREIGEPIRLFGETPKQRLKRWRRLTGRDSSTPAPVLSDGPIPTILEPVPEADMKIPEKVPKDEQGKKFLFRQLASYFTMVLKNWQHAMDSRTDEVKSSYQGKAAYNAMVQALENLRPFFKRIEKADMDESVVDAVVEIVHAAQERRYVDANDAYLRLSIGKAYVMNQNELFQSHPANVIQCLADWSHHGWHPRAFSSRETSRERQNGTYHER